MGVVFGTVVSGVAVYVVSEIFMKLVLEPAAKQREAIAEIVHRLIFFADIYSNPSVAPPEALLEATRSLRDASSRLLAATWRVRAYERWEGALGLPPRENVDQACAELIGLSNTTGRGVLYDQQRWDRRVKITRLLGIPNPG